MSKPGEHDNESDTGEKNFLARWSRRKREAEQETSAAAPTEEAAARDPQATIPSVTDAAPFDPASLPGIETIGPQTDISGFLKPGVPPDLTRAALRRAWSVDPSIRDYIGPSENAWDFNDPKAMGGFGPLAPDTARQLLAGLFGDAAPPVEMPAAPPAPAKVEPPPQESTPVIQSGDVQVGREPLSPEIPTATDAAPQQDAVVTPKLAAHHRGGHGGALPQ
jgi:hypothetical protein